MDSQSIRPLTLRNAGEADDYDEEFDGNVNNNEIVINEVVQEEKSARDEIVYPKGYTKEDDINQDGVIDHLEAKLKILNLQDNIKNTVSD